MHVDMYIDDAQLETFRVAFMHKSASASHSYERMEFLGDSINSAILSAYIFRRFPRENEGFLSRLRAYMISGKVYAEVSRQIGLPGWVQLGEDNEHLRLKSSVHEDVYEAFVGAMFLAFGYPLTESWVVRSFEEYVDVSEIVRGVVNPRERLTNYCLSVHHKKPIVQVTTVNDGMFCARVFHPDTGALSAESRAQTSGAAIRNACTSAMDDIISKPVGSDRLCA
jgi:ribonuclease-3